MDNEIPINRFLFNKITEMLDDDSLLDMFVKIIQKDREVTKNILTELLPSIKQDNENGTVYTLHEIYDDILVKDHSILSTFINGFATFLLEHNEKPMDDDFIKHINYMQELVGLAIKINETLEKQRFTRYIQEITDLLDISLAYPK